MKGGRRLNQSLARLFLVAFALLVGLLAVSCGSDGNKQAGEAQASLRAGLSGARPVEEGRIEITLGGKGGSHELPKVEVLESDSALLVRLSSPPPDVAVAVAVRGKWGFRPELRIKEGWLIAREPGLVGVVRFPAASGRELAIPLRQEEAKGFAAVQRIELSRPQPQLSIQGEEVHLSWRESFKSDFNNDGQVDFADVTVLVQMFGSSAEDVADPDYFFLLDSDGSGTVDFGDATIFVSTFGSTLGGYGVIRRQVPSPDQVPGIDLFIVGDQVAGGSELLRIPGVSPDDNPDLTVSRKVPDDPTKPNQYEVVDTPGPGFFAYVVVPYSAPGDSPKYGLPSQPLVGRGSTTATFLLTTDTPQVAPGDPLAVQVELDNTSAALFAHGRVVFDPGALSLSSCDLVTDGRSPLGADLAGFCDLVPGRDDTLSFFITRASTDFDPAEVASGPILTISFTAAAEGETTLAFTSQEELVGLGDIAGFPLPRLIGDPLTVSVQAPAP